MSSTTPEHEQCNLCSGTGIRIKWKTGYTVDGSRVRECSRCGGRCQVPAGSKNPIPRKHTNPTA